jgi:hypothetical protein
LERPASASRADARLLERAGHGADGDFDESGGVDSDGFTDGLLEFVGGVSTDATCAVGFCKFDEVGVVELAADDAVGAVAVFLVTHDVPEGVIVEDDEHDTDVVLNCRCEF